jgi:anti-sigma factor RsiW
MKTFEERFTAYVDGALQGAELARFEQELATHPEADGEKESALKLRRLLREHSTPQTLTNPDFFNLQIQERIAADQPRERRPQRGVGSFWSLSRLLWAGATCLLLAAVMFKTLIPTGGPALASEVSPYFAQVVESWPSDPSISASTVYSPADNVTVLWLDGLDYLPASYELK